MKNSGLSKNDKIIVLMAERAKEQDPACYLTSIAVLLTAVGQKYMDLLEGYTRGDFKRAIKFLRSMQKSIPQHTAAYGDAILLIRREWLHREPEVLTAGRAERG